mgnify:CR=1 FL=1
MTLIYRALTTVFYPFFIAIILLRKFIGKEDPTRYKEKILHTHFNVVRKKNLKLVWFHAASIGEFKSIIPIIEELIKNRTVWIRQKLKIHTETVRPKAKEYVNGESFTYLGRNYRLKCIKGFTGQVKLKNGYLAVPVAEGVSGSALEQSVQQSLHEWYQTRALEKLKEKTKRYSSI